MNPELNNLINNSTNILITSHVHPDPDAVCSTLGLLDFLNKKYPDKNAQIYFTSESYDTYNSLKNSEKINWVEDIAEFINDFDLVFFLDGNELKRFSNQPEKLEAASYKSVYIDHHPGVPSKFDLNLSDLEESSTSQIVYKLFFREEKSLLDKDVCQTLLLGIMGDTGTFRYISNKNSETLIYAKELVDAGELRIETMDLKISQMSVAVLDLLTILVSNTKRIESVRNPPFTYTYLSADALDKYSIQEIKNANDRYKHMFMRQIRGYDWGFTVTPDTKEIYGLSFRSTIDMPDVSILAKKFSGGGHIFAAGGSFDNTERNLSVEQVCQEIVNEIESREFELIKQ